MKDYAPIQAWLDATDFNTDVFIDVETISYDDKVAPLNPYKGHRITVIILGQHGRPTIAVPYRHRSEMGRLYDLDTVVESMRLWAPKIKFYANANPKFDLKFLAVDGILLSGVQRIKDTQVIGRLVKNDHVSLALDHLTKYYNVGSQKSDTAKEWIKANDTQDYGRTPLDILIPYGIADVEATKALMLELERRLPEESKEQWDWECRFTILLFKCEQNGLLVDKPFLMRKRIALLQEMITSAKELEGLLPGFNPRSSVQVDKYFRVTCGIDPLKYTDADEKHPSWDKKVLVLINKFSHGAEAARVAELIVRGNELAIQESTFCAGWVEHADVNSVVHSDFRQAGTNSGRVSCGDPNAQNFPKWMRKALLIPNGLVGVIWDLAQVEYRVFAHYAENDTLLKAYADNPLVDFHQLLADGLGFPRQPVKTINFAILFGMGQKKTKASLAKSIADYDSQAVRDVLQKYIPFKLAPYPEPITADELEELAVNILATYHKNLPEIKYLNKKIKTILASRGYIRNYYGRRIYLSPDKAYIGLNRTVQGGSADMFKRILVTIHDKCPYANIVNNIHDADMALMEARFLEEYWAVCNDTLTTIGLKVPILMDGKVAVRDWGTTLKITDNDIRKTYNELLKTVA